MRSTGRRLDASRRLRTHTPAVGRALIQAAALGIVLTSSCTHDLGESGDMTAPSAEAPASKPARLTISPTTVSLTVGDTARLTATMLDFKGKKLTGWTVNWRSSNPASVSVSSSGKLTALGAGSAAIYANVDAAKDTAFVSVASSSTLLPPPPSSTGLANECASASAAWIWCDDFDVDRLASYFEVDRANGDFARVSGAGQSGSYAMQGTFRAGASSAGNLKLAFGANPDQGYIDPVDGGLLKFRDIYWRMFVRTQSGWSGQGADKLSRAMVLASSSWGQAAIGHLWTPNGNAPSLQTDPVSGTDASGSLRTTIYNDFANFTWLGGSPGGTQLFSTANANTWFCVEAHMRLNDAGLSNGVYEFWVNQNLEARQTNLNWLGAFSAYGINAIFFENFWNDGSPTTQSRFFDNVVVSTERIGCGGGTPGGANPVAVVDVSGGSSLGAGASLPLAAIAKDKTNTPVATSLGWQSSNPAAATVSSTGVVTGVGSGRATITAESANGKTGSLIVTVGSSSAEAGPLITTSSLAAATVGTTYSQTLAATGGNGSYSWSITAGALPNGLTLNASTGAITGSPTAAGTWGLTVQATSAGLSDTQTLSIAVASATSSVNITTTTMPGATVNVAYSRTLTASGGNGSYSWSLTSGSLPGGLSLNASTGLISGTPTAAGTWSFTARATSAGLSGTQALSIVVGATMPPVEVTTTSMPGATVGAAYSRTLTASGGNGSFGWSITAGALPGGLSLNASTGLISGTPTAPGTWSFTVQASSGGGSDTQLLSIAVAATASDPVITTTTMPGGTVGVAYSRTLTGTGGTGNYVWSIVTGSLPAGLSLNASTGLISGTPTAPGTWTFTVLLTSNGPHAAQTLSIAVGSSTSAVQITTLSMPGATVGTTYSRQLAATGGSGTYSWAVTVGALPTGLSLNASTGLISGTPATAGTWNFTVQATSSGSSATQSLSIAVALASGGQSGGGSGASPIRDIDFENYSSTAAMMSDCVTFACVYDESGAPAGGTGTVALDATMAPPIPGLTKSMRYSYMHPGDGCNSITVERAISFPAAQEAWGEFYVRWSSNFRTSNNGCIPNDHKLIFGDTEDEMSGRWAFYVGADSPPNHSLMVEQPLRPGGAPWTGGYYLNRNSNPLIQPYPYMWDGNWHVIRLHFRHSTTTSSNDGAIQVWIDGRLLHDETGFNTKKPDGRPEKINGFSFSHNKDDGPAGVLMHLWWGRIRVWTSNPGW